MGCSVDLLEEALDLARKEKAALEDGAYEQAIELSQKRGKITGLAWNMLEPAEHAPYQNKLLELSKIQGQLADIAFRAHEAVKQRLCRSRQEKKRMAGYQLAVGHALH